MALVCDSVDAFWLIPSWRGKRRVTVALYQGRYVIFLRVAQGSRVGPLTYASVAALAARCVQSLFFVPSEDHDRTTSTRGDFNLVLQLYVDDPLAVARGKPARIQRLFAKLLLGWTVLGYPLTWHTADMGNKVV